jgi:lactoylglutathione lyase
MLDLSSTYLLVKDVDRSIKFYSKLLDVKPSEKKRGCWARFDFNDLSIALYSETYDYKDIAKALGLNKRDCKAYFEGLNKYKTIVGSESIFHFHAENLNEEYARVLSLDIGEVSDIIFMDSANPDHFFTVTDPDGNLMDISGKYTTPTLTPVIQEKEIEKIEIIEVIEETEEAAPDEQTIDFNYFRTAIDREKASVAKNVAVAEKAALAEIDAIVEKIATEQKIAFIKAAIERNSVRRQEMLERRQVEEKPQPPVEEVSFPLVPIWNEIYE